jgi:hypothetical protein
MFEQDVKRVLKDQPTAPTASFVRFFHRPKRKVRPYFSSARIEENIKRVARRLEDYDLLTVLSPTTHRPSAQGNRVLLIPENRQENLRPLPLSIAPSAAQA